MSGLVHPLVAALRDRGATSIELSGCPSAAIVAARGTGWSAGIALWPRRGLARVSSPVFLRNDVDTRCDLEAVLAAVDDVITTIRPRSST